jgi:hypothetical protein
VIPRCEKRVLLEDFRERRSGARRRRRHLASDIGPNSLAIASISTRAAVSAVSNASAETLPLAKKRCVMPTQPIFKDSSRLRLEPRPMMSSVDPPRRCR